MTYKHIPLQEFLEDYPTLPPTKEDLESLHKTLQATLEGLLSTHTTGSNDEEQEKTYIRDFLKDTFGYISKSHRKIDMAILHPHTEDIAVIFEFKSRNNKGEFVSNKANVIKESKEASLFDDRCGGGGGQPLVKIAYKPIKIQTSTTPKA